VFALFSDGTSLYGIDAIATSDIAIYTIDTSTGIATHISTLTGFQATIFLSMRQPSQHLRAGRHFNYSFFRYLLCLSRAGFAAPWSTSRRAAVALYNENATTPGL